MNPLCSIDSTKEERIQYLKENGPWVSLFDFGREVSIILVRYGKEEHHTFFRDCVKIVIPENRSTYPIPEDAPSYFIYAPTHERDEIIGVSKEEAEILQRKIEEVNQAYLAEDDNTRCNYCSDKLSYCCGDHEEDDDRASITSAEVRVNARILADEAAAKMTNEVEQEKQAFENEWASGRQRILSIHEARMAADADKQLAERMRIQAAVIEDYGSEAEFKKSRAAGEEAMRLIHVADRMRMATEGYKY